MQPGQWFISQTHGSSWQMHTSLPNNTPYNDTCPISQQHPEEVHTRKVDDEVPWVLDHLLHCDAICLEHLRLDEDSLHHNMNGSRSGKVGFHRGFMPEMWAVLRHCDTKLSNSSTCVCRMVCTCCTTAAAGLDCPTEIPLERRV